MLKTGAAGVVFVDVDTVGRAALNDKVSFAVALPEPVAGIRGLALRAGVGSTGLPIGTELDGQLRSDRRLIAIGLAFEKVLGRVPAPV